MKGKEYLYQTIDSKVTLLNAETSVDIEREHCCNTACEAFIKYCRQNNTFECSLDIDCTECKEVLKFTTLLKNLL